MSSLFTYTGEDIYLKLKTIYEDLSGVSLKASSVVSMLLRGISYFILLITKSFNFAYQNMWLKTCDEDTAELYGDEKDLTRDEAEASRMTVKFTRVSNLENEQSIPVGSRVAYNDYTFQTVATYKFGIGDNTVDCEVECTLEGSETNGIEAGKTLTIIDSIPHVNEAKNISASTGGSDQESLENFKEKIRKFPESYSCAGTRGAYDYFTRKADSSISDVYITNKSAGVTEIFILLKGGIIPSDEMVSKVKTYVSQDDIRAFNDLIEVSKPTEHEYTVDFDFYIPRSKETSSISIQNAITEAITSYTEELANSLGGSINPDAIRTIAVNQGAKRTILREPTYTQLEKKFVPKCVNINCNFLDLEDD